MSVIKEELFTFPSIVFAYFYGSARESLIVGDIDIAVYFDRNVLPKEQVDLTLALSTSLSAKLGLEIDVRPLNNTAVGYRFEVTGGELLFSRDEHVQSEFVERTRQEYFDFKPLMEQNLRDLLEP
jgi:predicted nucleotidyltransferase